MSELDAPKLASGLTGTNNRLDPEGLKAAAEALIDSGFYKEPRDRAEIAVTAYLQASALPPREYGEEVRELIEAAKEALEFIQPFNRADELYDRLARALSTLQGGKG